MAWTKITRRHYERRGLRYASDCSDGEWLLIEPFMARSSKVGRPRRTDMRDVWDAIQYIAATGGSVANMGHGRAASPSWGIRQHWRNAY